MRARTTVGPGTDSKSLRVKTNKEVLPVVKDLGSLETTTNTSYIHWSKPVNADRFQDSVFQYIVREYSRLNIHSSHYVVYLDGFTF